ncbi:bifunctional UDP-sugar hydrolase/5'-nucleotidase [Paenibacillus sp. FSL H7-0331]|uniref:bifunctional metallophosphatase/5'-nucleotidase n=1 Tax=Paenibacillus sp. FSL H7-0331 TaxID=1920421 RepID=UPI00096F5310|nr:bifunctional UDP-sugar hydrolase/5'-nucleotidase [Paenibacillus sp. FSL H7-0331]OMF14074.1 metallophosphoesterase [Paenibacillus sp. FSL H7-0331]
MASRTLRLRILHSNDIHSHFEQMPSIAAAFKELRGSAGEEHTLTLDVGDHIDRVHIETEGSGGSANLAIMNETGYDAVTIGNNEGLTLSQDTLNLLYGSEARFTVLCSNLLEATSGQIPRWGKAYHIIEKAGIKVGLIGVTAYFPDFYQLLGWDIKEPLSITSELVRELRPQVDLIVVLSHLGLRNDQRMADETQGIDLILGGHTHHLLEEPLRMGETYVCAAGKFGQYFGVVDIEIDAHSRQKVKVSASIHEASSYPADAHIAELVDRYRSSSEQVLSRQVAYLEQPLSAEWYEEAPLGNLLAAGIRRWTHADIAIVNAGQLLGGLDMGAVSMGRLLQICPSPINPCRMLLTGERIWKALEESRIPEFMEKPLYGFGFRGKVLGILNVDGMRVEYDASAPAYSKIKRVWIGSEQLVMEKEYVVGTIDMFTFGIGFLSLSEGTEIEYILPNFIRDVIREELQETGAIQASQVKRWAHVDINDSSKNH